MTSETELRDMFEGWLADMDAAIDRFTGRLPSSLRARLEYSPESLDALEGWLVQEYPTLESLKGASDMLDGAARYVGQTFREHLGGKWRIELDDPDDINYRLPLITGFAGQYSELSPITLVTAAVDRRTGTYLRGVFNSQLERARSTPRV